MSLPPGFADLIRSTVPLMHGWCTPDKAVRLAELVYDTRPSVSVELGIFGGRSLLALAVGHRAADHGYAWGFDPWTAEAAVEGSNTPENDDWWRRVDLESVYRSFVEHVLRVGVLPTCRWARLRSATAACLFADRSIGLLHQDSNHSEQVSCDEVERWADKLVPGGYWIQDDVDWPTTRTSQTLLEERGFRVHEDRGTWRIYRSPG